LSNVTDKDIKIVDEDQGVKLIWVSEEAPQFMKEFDNDVIDYIHVQLTDLHASKNYSEVIVNDLTEKCLKIISDAANKCGFLKQKPSSKKGRTSNVFVNHSKPWFDKLKNVSQTVFACKG
jgi:hypothetical protein